jgi:hypothetical protein
VNPNTSTPAVSARAPRTPRGAESGGALVMTLLFLVMMTLLGVSALTTGALQERMAAALQERTRVLHAAEYGIARTLEDHGEHLRPGAAPIEPLRFVLGVDEGPEARLVVEIAIEHIDTVPSASAGGEAVHHFRVTAQAASDATGARVRIHQGAAVSVPTETNLFFVDSY